MSTAAERLRDWIDGEGILTGWGVYVGTYNDKRDLGTKTLMIQEQSTGSGNVYLQRHNLDLIFIAGTPLETVTVKNKSQELARAARVNDTGATGLVKINPEGNPRGPFYMEDGRAVYELEVSVWTEDL